MKTITMTNQCGVEPKIAGIFLCLFFAYLVVPHSAQAAVLPEDRADALYHYYDGGGVRISGPAVLVRKGLDESLSFSGHYYIDNVTSASIDVEANASEYREERTEIAAGVDYLHEDTIFSFNYSNSEENDYEADTLSLGVAHEMLNGQTVLNLGVSRGSDDIGDSTDPTFAEKVDRLKYRIGVSQVLSKKLVVNMDYEVISAEGFLNNPYRIIRLNGNFARPETYPDSRSSQAVAFRALQYLNEHNSIKYDYRFYSDDWDIRAHTMEVAYTHYLNEDFLASYNGRYYTQNSASFYSDNFLSPQEFMARDKELSSFSSISLGFKLTWQLFDDPAATLKNGKLSFAYNRFKFDYDNFTHYATGEPYSFRANVFQLFFSLFY